MDKRTLDDYTLMEKLGSGVYGTVYKAKRKIGPSTDPIALKVIKIPKRKKYLVELTKSEVEKLKSLSSPECNPFVICYYDSFYDEDGENFLIEMELIEGQDMDKYVKKLRETKTKPELYYYLLLIAKDILKGLKYTHNKRIIHNDIKPPNIRIDTNNVPRIIDYGLACNMAPHRSFCLYNGGTPFYMAPESLSDKIKFPASDLWALGILLYKSATKKYPFVIPNRTNLRQFKDIIKNNELTKLDTSNDQLNELVNKLLIKDYSDRLTVDQALEMLSSINKPEVLQKFNKSKYPGVKIAKGGIQMNFGLSDDKKKIMSSYLLLLQ